MLHRSLAGVRRSLPCDTGDRDHGVSGRSCKPLVEGIPRLIEQNAPLVAKTPVEVEALVEGRVLPREPRWLGPPVRLIDCRGKLDIRSHARNAHTRAVRYQR